MKTIGRVLLGLVLALAAILGHRWLTKHKAAQYERELLELKRSLEEALGSKLTELQKKEIHDKVKKRMEEIREETRGMEPRDRIAHLLDVLPPDDGPGIWGT